MKLSRWLGLLLVCIVSGANAVVGAGGKMPVPDAGALGEASKTVRDLYRKEYDAAKTAASKQLLAKEICSAAEKTTNDLPGQYTLLTVARRIAIDAGDLPLALRTIDLLDATFQVDRSSMKAETIGQLVEAFGSKVPGRIVADAAISAAKEAVAANEMETAQRLVDLALKAAQKVRDPQLRRATESLRDEVAELCQAQKAVQAAQATLAARPDDPEANLTIGRFACFVQGDWPRGLPLLARGNDSGLKELARAELNNPATAQEQAQLGDGWWERAATESGQIQRSLQARAVLWYRKALPSQSGLARIKIEKRLAELSHDAVEKPSEAAGPTREPARAKPEVEVEPTPAKGKGIVVCTQLAAKRKPTGLAAEATPFEAPAGDGRRGANGFVIPASDKWAAKGTAWACTYRRDGSARGIHFIHPFRQGHVIVTFLPGKVHVESLSVWPGYLAETPGLMLERSKDFLPALNLSGDKWHMLRSVLLANGRVLLYVDEKLVAAGRIPGAMPLELNGGFQGEGFPRRLRPGEAGVIIGPRDSHFNEAQSIEFGPASVP